MKTQYMAVDQYGQTFHGLDHPRKDLLERLGYKYAQKMYQDTKDGNAKHTGYVIGGHWFTVYAVAPWQGVR